LGGEPDAHMTSYRITGYKAQQILISFRNFHGFKEAFPGNWPISDNRIAPSVRRTEYAGCFVLRMKPVNVLFAVVIFLSAFLLFMVEPMAAKQLLPIVGGSAAVWTTCLVFFQVALLAGYAYAHWLGSCCHLRVQARIHAAALLVALLLLGLQLGPVGEAPAQNPTLAIFLMLSKRIGLPFCVLAATTPLVQMWFQRSNDSGAASQPPWHLFALSNLGSLLALAAYPTLVEPRLTQHLQSIAWAAGFALFAVLCAVSMSFTQRTSREPQDRPGRREDEAQQKPLSFIRWTTLLWVLLPACGSVLLCAVTSYISQNIAAIPLLWILPLTAYLLSFIVTFSSPLAYPRRLGIYLAAFAAGILGYIIHQTHVSYPLQVSIPVFTLCLLLLCFFCHGELYKLRPDARHLTAFYLLVALGSALGALFAGVVEPRIFDANYDLAAALIALAAVAVAATWNLGFLTRLFWIGATAAMCWVALIQARDLREDALVEARSFYGCLRVLETHWPPEAGTTRILYHGTIEHGTQLFGGGLRNTPTSYYGRDSGAGLAIRLCCTGRARNVGIVGLGAGTLAAYGEPGDHFTFYEIDPLVERLAMAFFTYLRESRAQVAIVTGDARLSLTQEERHANRPRYDVLVLDAFSGDAVPVHLLTAEAISLYRKRLQPDGILAFHISSQYLDLAPVLTVQAEHAGMRAVTIHSAGDEKRGEFPADWVLFTTNPAFLEQPEVFNASQPLLSRPGVSLWTDEYNSLLPILRWTTPLKRAPVAPPAD
jgi:spermidine synthase